MLPNFHEIRIGSLLIKQPSIRDPQCMIFILIELQKMQLTYVLLYLKKMVNFPFHPFFSSLMCVRLRCPFEHKKMNE